MENDIPVYNIVIEYDDETGMIRNSFVKNPAVEIERFAFSKINNFYFEGNDVEQKFMSVSILADTPILRRSEEGKEFYVVFSKETVKKIVNKLVMQNKINEVSFQHNEEQIIDGVYLVEHFFSEKGRVESPIFPNVPDGSWITTYWVKDKEKYDNLLSNPNFNGFSIEINAKIEEAFSSIFNSIVDEETALKTIKEIVFNDNVSEMQKEAEIKKVLNKLN
jgi:hypothetical protein